MSALPSDPGRAAPAAVSDSTHVLHGADVSCGQFLRLARERRGVTLEQIAERTKLPLRHLEAMERDDFAALPRGMYRRAEIRAYAEAVGLDRTAALAAFDGSPQHAASPTVVKVRASAPARSPRRARAWIAAALACGVAVVALALWAGQPRGRDVGPVVATSVAASPVEHPSVEPVVIATSGRTPEVAPASQVPAIESNTAAPAADTPTQNIQPDRPAALAAASNAEPQLVITTEPEGAHVTVNGIRWGITPVAIRYLPPGTKRVRVTMDGYRAEEQVIQVSGARRPLNVRIPLRSQAEDGDAVPATTSR